MDVWTLPAAIFFCTMGMFAGAAALYLTGTRVRLLGHQAAEIVLFCLLFAIAVFAVIAAVYPVKVTRLCWVFDWWRVARVGGA